MNGTHGNQKSEFVQNAIAHIGIKKRCSRCKGKKCIGDFADRLREQKKEEG